MRRFVLAAGLTAALSLAAAAPAAASQPTHTVRPLHGGFVLPAGTACAFDVAGQPNPKPTSAAAFQSGGFVGETDFSDGSVMYSVRARGAYVNLETGAQFPTLDTYADLEGIDPDSGNIVGVARGQVTFFFYPGDQGPFGVVGSDGALYHVDGVASYTIDANTFATLAFAYTGSITDVCAALS
jgi:hypothetical protein